MNPQVVAAVIAASVSVFTLIGTLAAQYFGRRATSRQLDRTFSEQHSRMLNERFATAAGQLGDDKPSAVRLAGVYAMAGLADDWPENRQTCVDVLCGYLRMPYEPDPGGEAAPADQAAYRANREVRHSLIRLIGAHLRAQAPVSWQGLNLDFTGMVFDGGDFSGARFTGGEASFRGARFTGGTVSFYGAEFTGGFVSFGGAEFTGGEVRFDRAQFTTGTASFADAQFTGGAVTFTDAKFTGSEVSFRGAQFTGGAVTFTDAEFTGGFVSFDGGRFTGGVVGFVRAQFAGTTVSFGGTVSFFGAKKFVFLLAGAEFSGGEIHFDEAEFSGGEVRFVRARFTGATVSFSGAKFSGGTVSFGGEVSFDGGKLTGVGGAEFNGGEVRFDKARFSGGLVSFRDARFTGGTVDFRQVAAWTNSPEFDWDSTPPPGVGLPVQPVTLPPDGASPAADTSTPTGS
jgi:uncharacterized protein YjbI with pentapeptide repeats